MKVGTVEFFCQICSCFLQRTIRFVLLTLAYSTLLVKLCSFDVILLNSIVPIVPVPHFGAALQLDEFHEISKRLKDAGVNFIIEPHRRFEGQPGDQWTMFFKDPSGNNLEFKSMMRPENLFARYDINDV